MISDEEKYRDLLNHEDSNLDDQLADFLRQSSYASLPSGKSKAAIWNKIEETIDKNKAKTKVIQPWMYFGIAASVTLILVLSFFFTSEPELIQLTTTIGEKQTYQLPDGSVATLNANSLISYSENWNRELELSGEAFFEVKKGAKFIVKTDAGNVEVLGTSFNVFSRAGELEVACKTGKVKVIVPSKLFSESISPGEMVTFKSDTVRKAFLKPEIMGRWQSGEFYFSSKPFEDVLNELRRQFKVKIEFQASPELEFSGYFTNTNLDQALDMVCLPLGLKYEKISASTILISESE